MVFLLKSWILKRKISQKFVSLLENSILKNPNTRKNWVDKKNEKKVSRKIHNLIVLKWALIYQEFGIPEYLKLANLYQYLASISSLKKLWTRRVKENSDNEKCMYRYQPPIPAIF